MMIRKEKVFCKDLKVIVQFSTSPVGKGVSFSRFVAEALREVENSGLRYQLTPMATVLEADTPEEARARAKVEKVRRKLDKTMS